jgi:transposase
MLSLTLEIWKIEGAGVGGTVRGLLTCWYRLLEISPPPLTTERRLGISLFDQPIHASLRPVSPRLSRLFTAEVIVAKLVSEITLGIDVSKDELVVCNWDTEQLTGLPNQRQEIRKWLKSLGGPVRIAIEPTSTYHVIVVEEAHALDYAVYLINPRQLAHYREAVNVRNKTDPEDAWLLARYLAHEAGQLRQHQPPGPGAQRLWSLLKRRATVVKSRTQLQQSFAEIQLSCQALLTQIHQLLKRIDRHILSLIRKLGWLADYQRCLSIPGIGHLNATALVSAYHRGTFASSDAFISFLGFDVRLRESGKYKGQRKLTKRGEPELRRLLYCAAKPARCEPRFQRFHQKQLDKGLSATAANVILARKLARIAFTLMAKQQTFTKTELAC